MTRVVGLLADDANCDVEFGEMNMFERYKRTIVVRDVTFGLSLLSNCMTHLIIRIFVFANDKMVGQNFAINFVILISPIVYKPIVIGIFT